MYKILSLILLLSSIATANAAAFKSPDILVDSKLDYDWSGFLVRKLRVAMRNYGIDDPFQGRFEGPMLIHESVIGDLIPESSRPLLKDMGNVIGLKMLKTETKVELFDLAYDLKGFRTDLKATEQLADGLVLNLDFMASELCLTAEKLRFSIMIPGKKDDNVLLEIDVVKPFIKAKKERLINVFSRIKIQDHKEALSLKILEASFERMAQDLIDHPEDIDLNYERILLPEVSIRIGSKTVNFSREKILKLLREKHEAIKAILIAQMAAKLRQGTADSVFSVLDRYKLAKDHWMNSELIKAQLNLSQVTSNLTSNNIGIKIPADFCTIKNFNRMKKECVNFKDTKATQTRIDEKLHRKSLGTMKSLMEKGEANIIASISEDYLNKLLVTTYDAGLWKEALKEAGVELGPNKVMMRMDKRGDSGTLIMDVINRPSKTEAFLIGSKSVRFPLVMDVSLRIEKQDEEPVVIVRLNDVDLTEKTLKYGIPEIGVVSGIKNLRFKGRVIKTIRKKLTKLKQKDVIELRFPEMRGLGLDKVDFLSDGNGRMHAMMRLEDLLEPELIPELDLIEELK